MALRLGAEPLAKRWWKTLNDAFDKADLSAVPGLSLLQAVLHIDSLRKLSGQVLVQLACRIELVFGSAANKGLFLCEGTFAWSDLRDRMRARGYERELALYVNNGNDLFKRSMELVSLSIATDKATVSGLPLQFSVLASPSNHVVLCCPQALGGAPEQDHRSPSCNSDLSALGPTALAPSSPISGGGVQSCACYG